eukprot:Seg740.3 transcript_id=Seg740.3/GoldUCD/mRNA.D3Y31 product="hypothetical protein" protein_id=Seg740.3/GoldUCD/D3Y31
MPVINEGVELSTVQLQSFTRLAAFTCKIPPTRTPKNVTTKRHLSPYPVETPSKHRCITPEATLFAWKAELQMLNRMSRSSYTVECEFGSYNLSIVDAAMQLHRACEIRAMVEQEIDWFAESFKSPASVHAIPPRTSLNAFRSSIHNHRYSELLRDFEMDPQELSKLCCNRYLAGDHMRQSLPKRIGIILNVGKRRHVNNGNEEWEVFMGAMGREGNHFSTAVVDTESNIITYGNSLGWGVPKTLLTFIRRLYVQIFQRQMPDMEMNVCHPTPDSSAFHECSRRCASLYPLQQNGTVCGVVAIVVLAIACLAPRYYSVLTDKMLRGANHLPSLFISRPHTYAKYLRRVIMTWFSEKYISIKYITPTQLLGLDMNNQNNTDALKDIEPEDEEDVVLVDFEANEEVPAMPKIKMECTTLPGIKKEANEKTEKTFQKFS